MLEISSVRAGYDRTTVLHGVTVAVPEDGVATVLGHNGAGKSTLLRAAMGLIKPRSGTVRLDGEDITHLAPHQRVARGMAYVPQGQQCFPHLTIAENLQLVADGRRRAGRRGDRTARAGPGRDPVPRRSPLGRRGGR
ncbi:ATP-binding cassette domain-containing protein, partial [Streptomyces sp. NPDC004579]|uniref:ATP-binding cassette domain-containing protein n=1 Tax=Streptomyces sp. NPDC004579 TaxID=3154667 RepID=UPI0033B53DFE